MGLGMGQLASAGVAESTGVQEADIHVQETEHHPPSRRAVFTSSASECQDLDDKLDQCHTALMAAWSNTSHPIEVAELDASVDAAQRFADVYYADDDPAEVEEVLRSEGTQRKLVETIVASGFEMEGMALSCEPLPCVIEIDVVPPGDESVNDEELWQRYRELKTSLSGWVADSLDGYHSTSTTMNRGGLDGGRTYHAAVSTRTEADVEELGESMLAFALEALGYARFE